MSINWDEELKAFNAVTGAFSDINRQKLARQQMDIEKQKFMMDFARFQQEQQEAPYRMAELQSKAGLQQQQALTESVERRRLSGQVGMEAMLRRQIYKDMYGQEATQGQTPEQAFSASQQGQTQPPASFQPYEISSGPTGATVKRYTPQELFKQQMESKKLVQDVSQSGNQPTINRLNQIESDEVISGFEVLNKKALTMKALYDSYLSGELKSKAVLDTGVLNTYQLILDERGVVRDPDIQLILTAQGVGPKMIADAWNALKGGKLNDTLRRELVNGAMFITNALGENYDNRVDSMLEGNDELGINTATLQKRFKKHTPYQIYSSHFFKPTATGTLDRKSLDKIKKNFNNG